MCGKFILATISAKANNKDEFMKRIGILTRDCAGINTAIRAVVRTACHYNIEVLGVQRGYEGLINGEIIKLDRLSVSGIINRGGTILKTTRSKKFLTEAGQEQAIKTVRKHNFDKKVSNFKYILSSKGTSDQFNAIDVDMSDFQVLIKVSGESKEWGRNETAGTAITVDMDGLWHEIYRIQVDSSELSALDIGFYNMSFIPFGSMEWRGSLSDDWTFIKLPSTFYLNFDVVIEDTDDDGFLDDEEKQIEVELISGTSET